jgi:hypothetical protein
MIAKMNANPSFGISKEMLQLLWKTGENDGLFFPLLTVI